MNISGLLFLLITQYIAGRGLVQLLKVETRPILLFCFSMISGVGMFSFLPFFLELLHLDITITNVAAAIGLLTIVMMVPLDYFRIADVPECVALLFLPAQCTGYAVRSRSYG